MFMRKSNQFDLVIFDLDGTLIDTIGDLSAAVNHAMSLGGYPQHSEDEYRMMLGNGVRKLVERALPDSAVHDVDKHLKDFYDYYCSHIDVHSRAYDGIPALLSRLCGAGVKLAVASNKFQWGTQSLIGSFFPDVSFCAVMGGIDGRPLKPDPAVIDEIIALCGVEKSRVAMVGDSSTDIRSAQAAGVTPIGVSWGFRSRDELCSCGAAFIADTPAELENVLIR